MDPLPIDPPAPDARRESRQSWRRAIDGELALRESRSGIVHPATLIDVSDSGARLAIDQPVAAKTEVVIVLKSEGLTLEFMAGVAWCRPIAELQPLEPCAIAEPENGEPPALNYGAGLEIRGSGCFWAMLRDRPVPI